MNNLIQQSGKTSFSMQINSIDEGKEFASMIAGSDLAPKDYRGKPANVLVAMMLGNEIGLNPIQAMQNISVINGRPALWGDAMLALCRQHPEFEGIKETYDGDKKTATCEIKRKGEEVHIETFSEADAKEAGLLGKAGPWKQYKKRMIKMRARGFALRDTFPDALLGLITAEEAQDMPVNVIEAKTVNDEVANLNQTLSIGKQKQDEIIEAEEAATPADQEQPEGERETFNTIMTNLGEALGVDDMTYAKAMDVIIKSENPGDISGFFQSGAIADLPEDQRQELFNAGQARKVELTRKK